MPATRVPTLRLSLQLEGTDPFGAMEWVFASARRTGLAPAQLRFDQARVKSASQPVLHATLTAADASLLWLFLRRLESGIDMAVLGADVDDPDSEAPCEPTPAPRTVTPQVRSDAGLALPA
ncbi:AsnC family transcriptional regulator [Cupriavidus consociatus]|uniref:AsnC family transcriptional regulator n=1 Tax=Cupriavidus consociatus TaxID=2821357 RepID=UPI001AE5E722|nr:MULTISPECIES: AsnC family transcriptional regulator [unclassified Cupriavidus]MBP0619596.1 AsnC family transcriptional regulator [Cupriavidus sp. LEh25]MDK2656246.1 AsnC family transcriptional regulator [Cupriavidus sp. LEh21]